MTSGGLRGRPHRIAFIITELEVGGAERCLTNLVLRMDKNRFQPSVYSLAPPPSPDRSALVDQLRTAAIDTQFLGARSIAQAWSTLRTLQNRLRAQAPDLVQTFLFHANVLGSRAAKAARVPRIVHGVRVADPAHWRQMVERYCARDVDRVVCVSQSVATFLHSKAGYPFNRLIVIPNGIDGSLYANRAVVQPDQLPVANDQRIIVVVARLHAQKGIEWLIKSMPHVFATFPDVQLWIVGSGPDSSQLVTLCQQLRLASRVHFLGWRNDVADILAASDLFLLPSRWEGMPNALLEAMASGLPVVATRAEGTAELLGPLGDEQLVDFGEGEQLIASITSKLRAPQQAKDLGKKNRRQAATFSLDRMVRAYEDLYEEILTKPASSGA